MRSHLPDSALKQLGSRSPPPGPWPPPATTHSALALPPSAEAPASKGSSKRGPSRPSQVLFQKHHREQELPGSIPSKTLARTLRRRGCEDAGAGLGESRGGRLRSALPAGTDTSGLDRLRRRTHVHEQGWGLTSSQTSPCPACPGPPSPAPTDPTLSRMVSWQPPWSCGRQVAHTTEAHAAAWPAHHDDVLLHG